ncbi:MAG: hypothetical protein V3V01_05555 [Acidimicrobiales bacterium]
MTNAHPDIEPLFWEVVDELASSKYYAIVFDTTGAWLTPEMRTSMAQKVAGAAGDPEVLADLLQSEGVRVDPAALHAVEWSPSKRTVSIVQASVSTELPFQSGEEAEEMGRKLAAMMLPGREIVAETRGGSKRKFFKPKTDVEQSYEVFTTGAAPQMEQAA